MDIPANDSLNQVQNERLFNIEGISYIWSPTNRTLTLYDRTGKILSQVLLNSLYNQITNLRYNSSTNSLELLNADNQFIYNVNLVEGENTFTVSASNTQETVEETLTLFLDTTEPVIDNLYPATDIETTASAITISGTVKSGKNAAVGNSRLSAENRRRPGRPRENQRRCRRAGRTFFACDCRGIQFRQIGVRQHAVRPESP